MIYISFLNKISQVDQFLVKLTKNGSNWLIFFKKRCVNHWQNCYKYKYFLPTQHKFLTNFCMYSRSVLNVGGGAPAPPWGGGRRPPNFFSEGLSWSKNNAELVNNIRICSSFANDLHLKLTNNLSNWRKIGQIDQKIVKVTKNWSNWPKIGQNDQLNYKFRLN